MADYYASLGANAQLHLRVTESSVNVAGNYSTVRGTVWLERTAGTGRYSNYTNNSWSDNIGGQGASGSGTYDLRGAGSQVLLDNYFNIVHADNGTKTISVSASFSDPHGNIGSGTASGALALTSIPRAPGAPTFDSITNVTAVAFDGNYTAPASVGGSAITGYTMQVSTSATFSSIDETVGPSLDNPLQATGLTPNTLYYARIKATNSQGDSAWSATRSVTLGASGAPHLAVIPKWDRSGFYVQLSLPFSVGSVTSYTYTRTVSGPGAPAPVSVTTTATSPNFDALVLKSGQTVTYQAIATVGGSDTGPSNSVSVAYGDNTVPIPIFPLLLGNVTPPGALANTEQVAWTGTAEASTSTVTGRHPKGWRLFSEGAGESGAVGVVTQIAKSLGVKSAEGSFDVMAVFSSTQTDAGFRLGTAISGGDELMIPVFGTINYYASITTMVDVATRLAAEIEWFGSDGSLLGRSTGPAQAVDAATVVTLSANDSAPSNAVYAAVNVVDVDGTGWAAGSVRFAGNVILSASTPLPFYDGDTFDDANYQYEWMDDDNASASLRIASTSSVALQDPDDDPLPQPPTAPAVEESAVSDDVVWRRYIAAIPANEVYEWVAGVPTLSLFAQVADEHQVRIRYWENPNDTDPDIWTDQGATMVAEMIVSYIPGASTFTIDGISETAWVVFSGDTQRIDANHLLFGQNGGPVTWPELSCGMGYILTLDVPVDATADNIVPALDLTSRML